MSKISLGTLAVIKSAVTDGTARSADCETPVVEEIAAAVSIFGSFVDNLIKRREYVIGELDLCNQNLSEMTVPPSLAKTDPEIPKGISTTCNGGRSCD